MSDQKPAVFVRRSTLGDLPALARLATASGEIPSPGAYLVAEVHDEMVAAAPLEACGRTLHDPSVETEDICLLLARWAGNLRRHATEVRKAA